MSRELVVAWAGRRQRQPWAGLCEELSGRIRRFVPIRELVVKARTSDEDRRREAEGAALLAALPTPVHLVALTRRGRPMSSPELSRWLERELESWPHAVSFLVGSDLGLSPAVLEAATLQLSLGPMTLPHELARLVLYEQLYRAFAIRHGIKYHRPPF